MNVVVCGKVIPASTVTIEIDPNTKRMMRKGVPHELDPAAASAVEEGLRIILANGLTSLKQRQSEDERDIRVAYANLASQYSVMKFRAFQYLQAAQILDMKINALRSEREMLRQANESLRTELQSGDGDVSTAPHT